MKKIIVVILIAFAIAFLGYKNNPKTDNCITMERAEQLYNEFVYTDKNVDAFNEIKSYDGVVYADENGIEINFPCLADF